MFHRVDDIDTLSVQRFYSLVKRLPAYGGALRAVISPRPAPDEHPAPQQQQPAPLAPVPGLDLTPQNADALLNNELYGALPGMGPVFSHSYAPLDEED